jgi:hypothetical protein
MYIKKFMETQVKVAINFKTKNLCRCYSLNFILYNKDPFSEFFSEHFQGSKNFTNFFNIVSDELIVFF